MKSLNIIKIGGNVIDDEASLSSFLEQFAQLPGAKILVHGGGKLATRLAEILQVPQKMINGRRVTDAESLKIVTMVYAGEINKRIVAGLQANNCNAIGLSGADGNLIQAKKREVRNIDYGFVGDLDEHSVNTGLLQQLLQSGYTPVLAPITHNKAAQLLNTNADTIASAIAVSMCAIFRTTLIYCFEKEGVLQNVNDEHSVIPEIQPAYYTQLKNEGIITAGMLPKIDNAFAAVNKGVAEVIIGSAERLPDLPAHKSGTRIHNG